VVILNVDQRRLMLASLLRYVVPTLRFKLVSVDLILRPPLTRADRLKTFFKKLLFSRVHRFILYFKNTDGYHRFYGIDAGRVVYVPFKVNGWEHIVSRNVHGSNGDYVLCAGRTLRDIATFVTAMRRISCPGMLLQQRREIVEAHGTKEWSGELPPNVRLVIDDSDNLETYMNFINNARLMVIPRYKYDIAPTGISTYLVAMALQKCVIISEGPGAEDVLTDQAVVVPAGDDRMLSEQIELLWSDHERRTEIASRARQYAHSLGGEERLLSDILKISLRTLERGA
jgi:glycosyltransferase involved in cell wall biosynthesis